MIEHSWRLLNNLETLLFLASSGIIYILDIIGKHHLPSRLLFLLSLEIFPFLAQRLLQWFWLLRWLCSFSRQLADIDSPNWLGILRVDLRRCLQVLSWAENSASSFTVLLVSPLSIFSFLLFLGWCDVWGSVWPCILLLHRVMEVHLVDTFGLRSVSASVIRWLKVQELSWQSLLGLQGTIETPWMGLHEGLAIGF